VLDAAAALNLKLLEKILTFAPASRALITDYLMSSDFSFSPKNFHSIFVMSLATTAAHARISPRGLVIYAGLEISQGFE
jgi:hypothetical protein